MNAPLKIIVFDYYWVGWVTILLLYEVFVGITIVLLSWPRLLTSSDWYRHGVTANLQVSQISDPLSRKATVY